MQIQPATIDQIAKGRNGRRIHITADVSNVAQDLANLDPNLQLHFNEDGYYYEVRCWNPVHKKSYLVTTALQLDQRIVDRIRQVRQPKYSYARELEGIEKQREKDQNHKRKEQVGEIGERLAHAMRKDKGIKKNF